MVPYHRTLLNAITKVIEESKVKYPGHYIQVKVDADKFQLKVSKMKASIWENNVELTPPPDSVLDLSRIGPYNGWPANLPVAGLVSRKIRRLLTAAVCRGEPCGRCMARFRN
jgi:hypothetical protein